MEGPDCYFSISDWDHPPKLADGGFSIQDFRFRRVRSTFSGQSLSAQHDLHRTTFSNVEHSKRIPVWNGGKHHPESLLVFPIDRLSSAIYLDCQFAGHLAPSVCRPLQDHKSYLTLPLLFSQSLSFQIILDIVEKSFDK